MVLRARRLATIAKDIEASLPGFRVKVRATSLTIDRKPKGVRWRIPGKRRAGNELVVLNAEGREVLRHNA